MDEDELQQLLEGGESIYSCVLTGDVLEEESMMMGFVEDEIDLEGFLE